MHMGHSDLDAMAVNALARMTEELAAAGTHPGVVQHFLPLVAHDHDLRLYNTV